MILNCKKYINKAIYQKNTWIPKLPSNIIYYHVIGEMEMKDDFIFDNENRVLYVKSPDDYVSLPKKVIRAYEAIHKTFDYQYIFKTDDDQFLVDDTFFQNLTNLIEKKDAFYYHYGGKKIDVKTHISTYYKIHPELPKNILMQKCRYCNGRFYMLSFQAIEDLLTKKENIEKECFEDYAIGFNLKKEFKKIFLNIESSKYFRDF